MYQRLSTFIVATFLSLVFSVGAWAQGRIDDIIIKLEKNSEAEVTNIERRNPKDRKIIYENKIIRWRKDRKNQYASALWRAFDAERKNSIESKSVNQKNYAYYLLTFDEKNMELRYVISYDADGWMLVVKKSCKGMNDDNDLGIYIDTGACFDNLALKLNDLSTLNLDALQSLGSLGNLRSLEQLEQLKDLDPDALKNIGGNSNIVISSDGERIIIESSDDSGTNSRTVVRNSKKSKSGKKKTRSTTTTSTSACSSVSKTVSGGNVVYNISYM